MCVFAFLYFSFSAQSPYIYMLVLYHRLVSMERSLSMRTLICSVHTLTQLRVSVRNACIDSRIFSIAISIGYARVRAHMLDSKNRTEFLPFNRAFFQRMTIALMLCLSVMLLVTKLMFVQYEWQKKTLSELCINSSAVRSFDSKNNKLIVLMKHASLWWNSFL